MHIVMKCNVCQLVSSNDVASQEVVRFLDFFKLLADKETVRICVFVCARARMAHHTEHGCLIHVCNTDALHLLCNTSLLGNYNFDLIALP